MLKFEPHLTAVCRLNSKFLLTVNADLILKVLHYVAEEETYAVIATEKLHALLSLANINTRDLLDVDKLTAISKSEVLATSGRSKNIVLLKLKNGGDFDKPDIVEDEM